MPRRAKLGGDSRSASARNASPPTNHHGAASSAICVHAGGTRPRRTQRYSARAAASASARISPVGAGGPMPVLSSARPIREVTFMGRDRLSARRRALRLLVPALLLAVAVMAPGALPQAAQAATPTHGTIDGTSPVQWNFAPVGGP